MPVHSGDMNGSVPVAVTTLSVVYVLRQILLASLYNIA